MRISAQTLEIGGAVHPLMLLSFPMSLRYGSFPKGCSLCSTSRLVRHGIRSRLNMCCANCRRICNTLAPDTAQNSLAERVGARGFHRRFQNPNICPSTACRNRSPHFLSLSRMRKRGPSANCVASRSCIVGISARCSWPLPSSVSAFHHEYIQLPTTDSRAPNA